MVGRLVKLGPTVDTILSRHAYPEPVSKLLGEAVALTALLGAALKFEGKFILQASTDGPVDLLVADYQVPGGLRGYARFSAERLAELPVGGRLLGEGHLAMTIDRGVDTERYQGVVPLEGESLTEAADTYFRQSEQLPTFIRLAVARHYRAGSAGGRSWTWRAGGLLVQKLTREGGRSVAREAAFSEEDWTRAKGAGRDGRGSRAARSVAAARPPALPAVPRGAGARVSRHSARKLLQLLAGARRGVAEALLGGRPRRDGGRRRNVGDLRVLQQPLPVRSRFLRRRLGAELVGQAGEEGHAGLELGDRHIFVGRVGLGDVARPADHRRASRLLE